jgi:hypothetical protein
MTRCWRRRNSTRLCEGGTTVHQRRIFASALILALLVSTFAIGSVPAQSASLAMTRC